MLRLLVLLLPVLLQPPRLPALAPEPAAQDVSLGLVSGVSRLLGFAGAWGEGSWCWAPRSG